MRTSYREEDVILLLKDITGLVEPQSTKERELLIQSGRHYCEMLPIEYVPTERYMEIYQEALQNNAKETAEAVGTLADKILAKRGRDIVLVSLARAGIPIGILLKRFLKLQYKLDVPHYSISIIRGKGIDDNAMKYLLAKHEPETLLFVDGWVGKGAILRELEQAISAYKGVSPEIAVIADPANITDLCGTRKDMLIASSCLNSTVSGLVSRTFLRDDIIGKDDFHGAVYYGELKDADLSYEFIETIEREFILENHSEIAERLRDEKETEQQKPEESSLQEIEEAGLQKSEENILQEAEGTGLQEVEEIAAHFDIDNINLIKPGIGETTRVLLRRVPWKVLMDERYKNAPEVEHIRRLALEKQVPIVYYPLRHYKACGIIKKMADA